MSAGENGDFYPAFEPEGRERKNFIYQRKKGGKRHHEERGGLLTEKGVNFLFREGGGLFFPYRGGGKRALQ